MSQPMFDPLWVPPQPSLLGGAN